MDYLKIWQIEHSASEEDFFAYIFNKYQQRIFGFIYKMTGNRSDTEDVVQEVFLKIYKGLKWYNEESKLSSWIFSIARNTAMDYFRKKKGYREYILDLINFQKTHVRQGDIRFSPEEYLVSKEQSLYLEQIISALPYKLKEVFLLRYEGGLSFKEIAGILNCPLNRVLGRMHLAVNRVRVQMEKIMSED